MKQFSSLNSAFLYLCQKIKEEGIVSCPRSLEIKELIGETICIKNPRKRLMYNSIRKFSPQFAIGENLWYLGGNNELNMIQYYSPSYYKYSDNGFTLNGAYGPRIFKQIETVVKLLKSDTDTRQAIITIFNHSDIEIDTKDVPCTCTIQFLIRNNELDAIVYMRSNDLMLGFPYDTYSFTILQELVSVSLGVNLGKYYHFVGSLHIYENDYNKMVSKPMFIYEDFEMRPFSKNALRELKDIINVEKELRNGSFEKKVEFKEENWNIYQKILISKKRGCYNNLDSMRILGGIND